jgi:hypothetical protein
MMDHDRPAHDDLIVRPCAVVDGVQQYEIVRALTLLREAGPFPTFGDAVLAIRDLAFTRGVTAWHQRLDGAGKPVGPATRLFAVFYGAF